MAEVWQQESEWWEAVVARHVPPLGSDEHVSGPGIELVVEDLMLTTSGTLLLLLGDPAGAIEPLREQAAARWDETGKRAGGGVRPLLYQPQLVVHVSIARIIDLPRGVRLLRYAHIWLFGNRLCISLQFQDMSTMHNW